MKTDAIKQCNVSCSPYLVDVVVVVVSVLLPFSLTVVLVVLQQAEEQHIRT